MINIFHFLAYHDENIAEAIKEENDYFQKCMEILVEFMESNPDIFLTEITECYNLIFFKHTMPDSRLADYCLGCYGGSCFIDFNKKGDLIYLERISFDGFGCFEITDHEKTLTQEESQIFENEMKNEYPSQTIIRPLALKLIDYNKARINADIFDEYPLLRHYDSV